MSNPSPKRFVEIGQEVFTELTNQYHSRLHTDESGYGELEDTRTTYRLFAEMAFTAAEEFTEVFSHREPVS
jgi:hypothetical protein